MFDWIFKDKKPKLPQLYPNIDDPNFALFLSKQAYQAIKKFRRILVLPFVAEQRSQEENLFGAGLARLLIRNLMLCRNISVRGPEDTPNVPIQVLRQHPAELESAILVGGAVQLLPGDIKVALDVQAPNGKRVSKTVAAVDGPGILSACSETIATIVGAQITDETRQMWRFGQPKGDFIHSVILLGGLNMVFDRSDSERTTKAIQLHSAEPGMGSICSYIDDDVSPDARKYYLSSFDKDPYDAQLCFTLFCNVWESTGHEPFAFQFIRRGLELSPGHGKLHMCAPHTVHESVSSRMLAHSELGYRLLPQNPFAINNLILNLMSAGRPQSEILALAEEGIRIDPYDPSNYDRMIEAFANAGNYDGALQLALRLQRLYEPMHERTLYCLKQNPRRAHEIEMGQFNPAAENRQLINELKRRQANF